MPEGMESILSDLTEQWTSKLQSREILDLDEYAREHPDQARLIRDLIPTLRELVELGRAVDRGRRTREASEMTGRRLSIDGPEPPG